MSTQVDVLDVLGASQVAEVTALCQAAAAADGVNPLSEHVRLHLRHGGEGRDRHLIALRPDGALAGYAHLDPTDPVAGPVAELVVAPQDRSRGVGRALVAAALDAARAQRGSDRLRLWAHGEHPAAHALAVRFGFAEGRRLEQWRRDLDESLPVAVLPEGVRLRSFRPGVDDEEWLALNARAFAGHPEQGAWSQADLDARIAEDWFDTEGFLLAELDGALVGFHWTKVHGASDPEGPAGAEGRENTAPGHTHGHEPIGEVYIVGVDPAHHGLGLGRALTLAGLHWLAGQGLTRAMLYVEADNEAAKATYRRLGFRLWDTDVMFYRA